MNNKLLKYELYSTIIVLIMGTLLHFTYDWSNNNLLVGIVSAVNESTWEHLKLIFYPMLISSIIGTFYLKNNNYLCIKTKYIIYSMITMIIFFYTYSGILGTNYGIINILSYFVIIILFNYLSYKEIKKDICCNNILSIILLIIISILFTIFTFNPPHINLFLDPIYYTYGV